MMKFQNTERCSIYEKLKIVSSEILEVYPNLSSEDIFKISGLCDVVSDNVDCDVIFRRYYYILLVIHNDKNNYNVIYNDMKDICKDCLNNDLNKYLYRDIEKYNMGELESFPLISDYFG